MTLTLKPAWYQYTPQIQYDIGFKYLWDILVPYKASFIAELTGENNVHFHGMIELENLEARAKFLNKFRGCRCKYFGRKSCSQVLFQDSYMKYMRKDMTATRVCIKDPIVRDHFGIFKMLFQDKLPES